MLKYLPAITLFGLFFVVLSPYIQKRKKITFTSLQSLFFFKVFRMISFIFFYFHQNWYLHLQNKKKSDGTTSMAVKEMGFVS